MRRHSPGRAVRPPPSRRRGRGRSLSPLSRSQPAPPGEERGRKSAAWDMQSQSGRNKRFRSRSRSREWMDRSRDLSDREPPYMRMEENGRPRVRDPPRDKVLKEREVEKSRDRRDRDTFLQPPRNADLRDSKAKHHDHRRRSEERFNTVSAEFEENYLDNQQNNYENRGIHKNHDNLIMDPSSINFNTFVPEHNPHDKSRNMSSDLHYQPPRDHHAVPRDIHRPSPRERPNPPARHNHGSSSSRRDSHHEKKETPADRINRLEKLVEKLVENNVTQGKSKDNVYQTASGLIPELIPSNNKFTTSMWLNCIHEECLNRNYDEKSSIRFMQDQMNGIIKAWFKSVSNYDFTWPELKLLITKTFPDNIEFANTLKLLVLRDKTAEETITQYYFSKVYLCEACKITGENAVSCLIDGLSNPFMKQELKSYNFLTTEALYSDYLSKFPENEVPVRVDHRDVREVVSSYPNDEFIPLEMNTRELNVGRPYHRGEHNEDREARPSGSKKCFTCKKFGHATLDCRHAPICYRCKKKGHIAAKCHFNDALLISSETSSYSIPQMKCCINAQEYVAVIDTGCVAVTLKKQVMEDLGLNIEPTVDILKGFGDTIIVPIGETEVILAVSSAKRPVKVLVVEDNIQHVPVIIGQEFLSQDGVEFSQKNGVVSIMDKNIDSHY